MLLPVVLRKTHQPFTVARRDASVLPSSTLSIDSSQSSLSPVHVSHSFRQVGISQNVAILLDPLVLP